MFLALEEQESSQVIVYYHLYYIDRMVLSIHLSGGLLSCSRRISILYLDMLEISIRTLYRYRHCGHFSDFPVYYLVVEEAGSTRRERPNMDKQLVNIITCGCKSSAPFLAHLTQRFM